MVLEGVGGGDGEDHGLLAVEVAVEGEADVLVEVGDGAQPQQPVDEVDQVLEGHHQAQRVLQLVVEAPDRVLLVLLVESFMLEVHLVQVLS